MTLVIKSNVKKSGVVIYDKKNLLWFGVGYNFIQVVVCFLSPREGSVI